MTGLHRTKKRCGAYVRPPNRGGVSHQLACDALCDTSAMIDTSFSLGPMTPAGDGYPWTERTLARLEPDAFCAILRAFGAQRVLFGTDSPWSGQAAEVRAFRSLPLTGEEKALILGETACRLLPEAAAWLHGAAGC